MFWQIGPVSLSTLSKKRMNYLFLKVEQFRDLWDNLLHKLQYPSLESLDFGKPSVILSHQKVKPIYSVVLEDNSLVCLIG